MQALNVRGLPQLGLLPELQTQLCRWGEFQDLAKGRLSRWTQYNYKCPHKRKARGYEKECEDEAEVGVKHPEDGGTATSQGM